MPTIPPLPPLGASRRVILFSGHRIDAPARATPRFPAAMEGAPATAIDRALAELAAGADDLALTQGAAGGDILFAESCQRRGLRLVLMQPLPEAQFIEASVASSIDGQRWVARYAAVAAHAHGRPRTLPQHAGEPAGDVYMRCNQWMLDTALSLHAARLHLLCLWDGAEGDGPGGTAHMVQVVTRHGGAVTWLDTRRLGAGAPR